MFKYFKFLLGVISMVFALSCSDEGTEQQPKDASIPLFSYQMLENQAIAGDNRYDLPNTDLQYTGWGVYEDIIFPGTEILWDVRHTSTPALEGLALACSITGGDRYNNAFFTNTCALRWAEEAWPYLENTSLVMELDFYIDATLDCDQPNNSGIEGLEFTWQHIQIPYSYGFGLQWSKSGEWRYWNDEKDETGAPLAWQSFPIPFSSCLESNRWYHLKLEGQLEGTTIRYTQMTLDDNTYSLQNITIGEARVPDSWVENFLQVGMQINGNQALDPNHGHGTDPATVYLDNVSLIGY